MVSMIPYQKEKYNYWQSGKKGINYKKSINSSNSRKYQMRDDFPQKE